MGGHDEQLKTNRAWSVRCVNPVFISELRFLIVVLLFNDTTKRVAIMAVFEGVELDILHGVAVFTSGLTGHVIQTCNLKTIKTEGELKTLFLALELKAWWVSAMREQIELYYIRHTNEF